VQKLQKGGPLPPTKSMTGKHQVGLNCGSANLATQIAV